MLKRLLPLVWLLCVSAFALAQYNEKDILTQQAYQYLAQRQYGEAEKLLNQVLEQYPDDVNSVLQLMNIYFQTSQTDKAEGTLQKYRRILPQNQADEQQILLYVMQGKPVEAMELSQAYLQRNSYGEMSYRIVASYFERRGFYEQMLQLYREARTRLHNPELFRLEIGNTSLNFRLFDQALQEYLAFLDKNPGNLFFINNQCNTILKEDSTRIAVIGAYAAQSQNAVIKELYAGALVSQKKYSEALEIYKTLPRDNLIRFAGEQYNALNDDVALPAFQYLEEAYSGSVERNDFRLLEAFVRYRHGAHAETKLLLEEIIADSLMLERKNIQRKGINLQARKLMAENSLALTKDPQQAEYWLNEARKYCTNSFDTQDIDLSLTRLLLIQQDYESALDKLNTISEPQHAETRDYLRYDIELLRGNTDIADSLMNDYIIHYPSGKYVNDAIYQMMFTLELEGADRESFFTAYRLMLLQDSSAVDSLQTLFQKTKDEELLILAVEWAMLLSERDKALKLVNFAWQDPVTAEYASLLIYTLTDDSSAEQLMAKDFLRANPNSIFAPKFRQSLSKMNYTRPEY